MSEVAAQALGGTVVFVGTVRRTAEDGDIHAIEYSAYRAMAETEGDRIRAEAAARWPAARIVLRHRVGLVPAGEASVAVVAAAPHRAEAFDACRFVIEQIKARVPLWKREHLASGAARWVEGVPPGGGAGGDG